MIAVQTAIGDIGSKAVTSLSWSFNSMVNTGKFQYGFNDNGIYILNTSGEDEAGSSDGYEVIFANTDFGIDNLKRVRFIYAGIVADGAVVISVMNDNKKWITCTKKSLKTGVQKIRFPISRKGYGRYCKVKIFSLSPFKIDNISGLLVIRPLGIKG